MPGAPIGIGLQADRRSTAAVAQLEARALARAGGQQHLMPAVRRGKGAVAIDRISFAAAAVDHALSVAPY